MALRLFTLWLLTLLVGCSDSTSSCPHAGDGVCDEPVNCALGTDEVDCRAACAEGRDLHRHAAACAHRGGAEPSGDDGVPSGGTSHLTGHLDGTIEVPSGEDPATTARRPYRLFVPAHYDPARSTPLVLAMGGHQTPFEAQAGLTELFELADHASVIVAFVDQPWRLRPPQRWAWFTDWDWSAPEGHPDLVMVRSLVERLATDYNIDRSRVVTAGHSRGGAMALIAAIELSDIVAGAVVTSGFSESDYAVTRIPRHTGDKPRIVLVHGDADPDVPVEASDLLMASLLEAGWVEGGEVVYHRLVGVAHQWQPPLNASAFDFVLRRHEDAP